MAAQRLRELTNVDYDKRSWNADPRTKPNDFGRETAALDYNHRRHIVVYLLIYLLLSSQTDIYFSFTIMRNLECWIDLGIAARGRWLNIGVDFVINNTADQEVLQSRTSHADTPVSQTGTRLRQRRPVNGVHRLTCISSWVESPTPSSVIPRQQMLTRWVDCRLMHSQR